MVAFGDAIARRFFSYVSRPHRLATAFLVGLMLSTWLNYLASLAFMAVEQPLIPGDAVSVAVLVLVVLPDVRSAVRRWGRADRFVGSVAGPLDRGRHRPERWDWILIVVLGAFVTWMMASTFSYSDGQLRMGVHEWGDLGPSAAIAQSFALGHNFPTEYPLFAGEPILYHFLYHFQVGNLTLLGLDPATANNVLSIGSMIALLVLVMALGERLFRSAAVGRIGAMLFFVHGSLSFIPFLASFSSPAGALDGIFRLDHYLSSGLPYRGEDWAVWTQNVFLNQRHLASAIGIVLVVIVFLVDRLTASPGAANATPDIRVRLAASLHRSFASARHSLSRPVEHVRAGLRDRALPGYLLCGVLLGLLPLWNSAIYLASAVVLAVLFLVFPNRVQMLALAIPAAVLSIPQLIFLRSGSVPATQFPTIHWGYVVDDPTILNVGAYVAFIFGPKLILIAVALALGTWLQRRLFLAVSGLFALTFLVQLSVDIVASHKFLNAWLIVANLFAAYGLLRLWQTRASIWIPPRLVAAGLAAVIVVGGAIDLFPIKNDPSLAWRLDGDRVYDWVRNETNPSDVFLSDLHIVHPILLAGRRLYYGWPVYAWSAGYDTYGRDADYREMFQERSPRELVRRLQENRIAYVAIDDGLRNGTFVERLNEDVYRANLEQVFDDAEHGHLVIYKVPTDPNASESLPEAPPVGMYAGGRGSDPGRFDGPRGIAVEPAGTVLVADTQNHRIQRFSAEGTFLAAFGGRGDGPGAFNEPYGVSVDSRGHIHVADALNHRIQEFDAHDGFVEDWKGPDAGFYGPRDVAVGSDDSLYVVDQGHARIVRRSADGTVITFGSFGSGDGELNDPTAVAVSADQIFVADPTNRRIVVFDMAGDYLRSQPVSEWGAPLEYPDLLVSADGKLVFASSPATNQVIVFGIDGARIGSLSQASPELAGPAAMAGRPDGGIFVVDFADNRVSLLAKPTP